MTPDTSTGQKFLHCNVRSTSEHGDAPEFATIEVTPALVARAQELIDLRRLHRLCDLSEWNDGAQWGPDHTAEELMVRGGKLCVDKDLVWFSAYPKYGAEFETESIKLEHLKQILDDKSGKQHWLNSEIKGEDDLNGLKDLLLEAGRIPDESAPQQACRPRSGE